MNIFKILANGDGKINEANISAFLGYLLDPYQNHSLGYEFLHRFINKTDKLEEEYKDFKTYKYDYEILFEQAFRDVNSKLKKKEIVDIVILCFENSNGKGIETKAKNILQNKRELKYIFLIENKVNIGAKAQDQLKNQYNKTLSELEIDNSKVVSFYVTPDDRSYYDEFNSFIENDKKRHLIWIFNSEKPNNKDNVYYNEKTTSIYSILKDILADESKGNIEAINEYSKHTIISFMKFIENDFKSQKVEEKERKNDGTYTKRYIDLNVETNIENKLFKLRKELLSREPKWESNLSMPNLTKPRFPYLTLQVGDIDLQIHAGAESRDNISLVYRSNNRSKNSYDRLTEIAKKLNIPIKKADYKNDAYTRTAKMNFKYPIDDFQSIYESIREAIKQLD